MKLRSLLLALLLSTAAFASDVKLSWNPIPPSTGCTPVKVNFYRAGDLLLQSVERGQLQRGHQGKRSLKRNHCSCSGSSYYSKRAGATAYTNHCALIWASTIKSKRNWRDRKPR